MNMNKKLLKETQPVVYKTLSNALTKDHWLMHIYLKEIRVLLKRNGFIVCTKLGMSTQR